MGNLALDRYNRPPNYLKIKQVNDLRLFTRQVSCIQQQRSYYESLVIKEDIFNTKLQFKESVIRVIDEENERTESLGELIDAVCFRIKEWIQ